MSGPVHADLTSSLVQLANKFVQGNIPREFAPLYTCATLIPLRKKDEGVRPIAVGEIWRRILGKQVALAMKNQAAEYLKPNQFGVGVAGGGEAIVHATASIVHQHRDNPNLSVLQIDFTNAFNTVSRDAIFREIAEHFPDILNYVQFCYANKSSLFTGQDVVYSFTGVQQGDPLGPLLYSIVLQALVTKIKLAFPELIANLWFLDDGLIIGTPADLCSVLHLIGRDGQADGLHLNLNKCSLWWHEQVADWIAFPATVKRLTEGTVVLGSPIGSEAFVKEYAADKVETLVQLLRKVDALNDPQIELLLLRACTGFPRIVHLLRTAPPTLLSDALGTFDYQVDESIFHIVGDAIVEGGRALWALPLSMAGMGIPVSKDQAAGAFASSVFGSWELQALMGVTEPRLDAIACYKTHPNFELNDDNNYTTYTLSQFEFKMARDKLSYQALFAAADRTARSFLNAKTMKYASSWLHATPSNWNGQVFKSNEFKSLLKLHSSLPFNNTPHTCPECHVAMNNLGHHAISCGTSSQRTAKHDCLKDWIAAKMSDGGIGHQKEVSVNDKRMGDIVMNCYPRTEALFLDISVVNPLAVSYIGVGQRRGGAIAERERYKRGKYHDEITGPDAVQLSPIVCESLGGWSQDSIGIIKYIGARIAARTFSCAKKELKTMMTQLSCRLQLYNARMLTKRMFAY